MLGWVCASLVGRYIYVSFLLIFYAFPVPPAYMSLLHAFVICYRYGSVLEVQVLSPFVYLLDRSFMSINIFFCYPIDDSD